MAKPDEARSEINDNKFCGRVLRFESTNRLSSTGQHEVRHSTKSSEGKCIRGTKRSAVSIGRYAPNTPALPLTPSEYVYVSRPK